MPLLRSGELKKIIDKAKIQAVLGDARLADEIEHCRDSGHERYCPQLKQVRYFNDAGPDALETLAATKPADFPACDTAADDVYLLAFNSGTPGKPTAGHQFPIASSATFAKISN